MDISSGSGLLQYDVRFDGLFRRYRKAAYAFERYDALRGGGPNSWSRRLESIGALDCYLRSLEEVDPLDPEDESYPRIRDFELLETSWFLLSYEFVRRLCQLISKRALVAPSDANEALAVIKRRLNRIRTPLAKGEVALSHRASDRLPLGRLMRADGTSWEWAFGNGESYTRKWYADEFLSSIERLKQQ